MLSMLQQEILAKAKEIIDEKDYILLCKRANICPICGFDLIEDRKRKKEKKAAINAGYMFWSAPDPEKIATQKCTEHGFQW
jgi:hypothetical protein